jgi:dihydrofolate reductase
VSRASEAPLGLVVAADATGGIGRDGGLPWHLPGDLAHFKRITTATREPGRRNAVVMGRRTWASIPARFQPLEGRLNVVLTRRAELELPAGVLRAAGFDEALALARGAADVEAVFAIGGAAVFAEALLRPDCEVMYLTRVSGTFGCDTFLPPFEAHFERALTSEEHVDDGIAYRFEVWTRRPPGA